MQFSEAWLRTLTNPDIDSKTLVEQLTMAGLEVDAITPVANAFSGVCVGLVLGVAPHPDADRLRVCTVDVGASESLTIVCGAANVRDGLKVPVAMIGALLGENFKIKRSKLRGVESFGMLCSAKELGLAEEAEGLLELPDDAPIGLDLRTYLELDDQCIEVDLTPNRADCLSVEGIAREVAVLNQLAFQPWLPEPLSLGHQHSLAVNVDASAACPRYLGRVITQIDQRRGTPLWMQERLRRSGLRSLGPVVDVTNYVLLEMGQPLHAFDADRLTGAIEVRMAREGESLVLLNEQTLALKKDSLIIADAQQPLALAGIMGGRDSAVTDSTQTIFLECAFFHPDYMMGQARRYGLHTDSSHRFERGVDPDLQVRALARATQLLLAIVGGEAGPVTEVSDAEALPERAIIDLRRSKLERVLAIDSQQFPITDTLKRLGMVVTEADQGWQVQAPSFRFDIALEADLIEEVARVIGYNQLPQRPLAVPAGLAQAPEGQLELARVKASLVDIGYQEAITYSFVDATMLALLQPDLAAIRLQNPISKDMAVMRSTLWCGLLNAARYNRNRQQSRIRLFESGMCFIQQTDTVLQRQAIAGLAMGADVPEQWAVSSQPVDFYRIKGDVEQLLALTGHRYHFEPAQHPALHPGQSALISKCTGEVIGWVGALHPELQKKFELDAPVFLFELDQALLLNRALPKFDSLSRFPSVRRDLAILVADAVTVREVIDCVHNSVADTLKDVWVFDVYQGDGVPEGKKSIALAMQMQAHDRTLAESEIDAIFKQVLADLNAQLAAKLRD
ncbi:MAG: phenylalanine--tRNA ligase subunit beta [Methylococcales bacterium]|nr:phenylalanine--tRNA ligase subunit beta [Methylococcales bacterium]